MKGVHKYFLYLVWYGKNDSHNYLKYHNKKFRSVTQKLVKFAYNLNHIKNNFKIFRDMQSRYFLRLTYQKFI